ncbi:MAG TPA: PAS domain S-box protein [Planctomycetia bacterium]|nr:PAS domain S-box protein [Planctomycetia bacterium]
MNPETFLEFAELLPEPTFLLSGAGVVLAANRAAALRLNLAPASLPGRALAELVTDPPMVVASCLRQCLDGREPVSGSFALKASPPAAGRAEGALLSRAADGSEPTIMLRMLPNQSAAGEFASGNRRIEESDREIGRLRLAEEALRRQESWLRVILAGIGDGVIATDPEGRVAFMNAVAERLTGWDQSEAIGLPLFEVFRVVNERTRERATDPLPHRKETAAGRAVLLARDGTERPIEDVAAPIPSETGKSAGAVLVFRDVSERRSADADRGRLVAIVESSDDAIISKNLDGVIRTWNAGAERIFGYAPHEAIGRSITLIIPPEHLNEERAILERLRRGERVEHFETVRVAKDGRRVDVSLTVSPVRDAAGDVIGASKIARDVTRRREETEELASVTSESERRKRLYETILSNTPDLAYVFDLDHRFTYANEGLLRMWGKSWDEAIGRNCLELGYEPWHAAMHDREIDEVKSTKRPVRGEVPFEGAFGRRIYDYILVPVLGADGEVEAVAGTTRDVTERKEAESALRDADRRKNEFIALLAHELRNPLAPIRTGLQILRLAGADAATAERAREMMDRQLAHMVRMIDDLLDISRAIRDKLELRRTPTLLAEVIRSAVETARPVIDAEGHELAVDLPDEPILLDADLTRLAQVFSNLLTNSAKYTRRGGRIRLAAERTDGGVAVSVRDNGIGIPADSLPTVFDMFCQVDRSIGKNTGGLGIGLALVKALVELHGGSVVAASEGEGKGSVFTVELPVLPADAAAPDASLFPEATRPARRRVLVVDDNRDGAESLALMLELLGDEVETAGDGLDAIERAELLRPQVIFMDVGMPRLDGLEATRRIRALPWSRDVKIVALTGWGQDSDRARSRAAGCDAHLVKPVSRADLERTLTELTTRA